MSLLKSQRDHVFASLFKRFMKINNKFSFSSDEIKAISFQLFNLLKIPPLKSIQTIVTVLAKYGVVNIWNKQSKSCRHKYWFTRNLDSRTLKVSVNV